MELDVDIRKTLQAGARQFHLQVQVRSNSKRIVIVGPSGAGKSVLLKTIVGLIKPDQGHIRLGKNTLFDAQARINLTPQARQLGYLFQDYALFPHLTVRQNIGFSLARGWRNPPQQQRLSQVDYWLETFELQALADQFPVELSGGQRQRTALARALVAEPQALLLDEPFAALDADLRTKMRADLAALQQRIAVPIILITHDAEDARALGEHILHLQNGQLTNQYVQQSDEQKMTNDGFN